MADVVDAPVTLAIAAPQIAQFLANRKIRELAQAEIGRLRSAARIEYLNKELAPDPAGGAALARTAGQGTLAGATGAPIGGVAPATTAGAAPGGVDGAVTGPQGGRAVPGASSGATSGAVTGAVTDAGNTGKDDADNVDKAALERGVGGLR